MFQGLPWITGILWETHMSLQKESKIKCSSLNRIILALIDEKKIRYFQNYLKSKHKVDFPLQVPFHGLSPWERM